MSFPEIPQSLQDHYRAKAWDLPVPSPSTVSDLLRQLDNAVIECLHRDGPREAIDSAFDAVINHPDSTWKPDVLRYRIRQLHYH